MTTLYHALEIIIFIPAVLSVSYLFIFSLFSLLPSQKTSRRNAYRNKFLIIFPAYAEDSVIKESVSAFLKQDYPAEKYDVVVVSDHMKQETNQILSALPIKNIIATYTKSSKAKALQLAIQESDPAANYNYVVILDADNQVDSHFLEEINAYCKPGTIAIQAHRQAKNINTPVALLDAISEEINNTIFREAHVKVGMSSALIGSGMCFSFSWFRENVWQLSSSGEDKELEEALLKGKHKIDYLSHIPVYDEKVQSKENFGNQRKRWIAAQIFSAKSLGKRIPNALRTGNWQLIDKFTQQLLLPRSMCLVVIPLLTVLTYFINPIHTIKWIVVTLMLFISLLVATPRRFYNRPTLSAMLQVPHLAFRMMSNLLHLKGADKNFIHTQHGTHS